MAAFTEEQQAVLREAFHHMWSRMSALHDDLNEDSLQIASAITALGVRGLLSPGEIDRIAAQLHIEAGLSVVDSRRTEQEITAAILGGDLEAFRREDEE